MGDLGPLRGQEESPHDLVGCVWGGKEAGRKSGGGMGPVPLRGSRGRGGVHTLGGDHSQGGDKRGQGETFSG